MANLIDDREALIREWTIARPTSAPVLLRRMAGDCDRIAAIDEYRGRADDAREARNAAGRYRAAATRHEFGLSEP